MMHYIKRLSILAYLAIALSGCNNDAANDALLTDDMVDIPMTLTVDCNAGMRLADAPSRGESAREPRRPLSWTGQQAITDMRIYVFESTQHDGEYVYAGGGNCPDGGYLMPEFNNPTPVTGENESHVYKFTPKLKKGKYYKFLAVGRDDNDCLQIPSQPKVVSIPWGTKTISDANFKVGETKFHEASLTNMLENGHYPYITTEIFAGVMTYKTADGKLMEDYIHVVDGAHGFQKHIILKRAVAALWIYVTDVPSRIRDNSGSEYDGETFTPYSLRVHMEMASPNLSLLYDFTDDKDVRHKCAMVGFIDFSNTYGRKTETWSKTDDSQFWRRPAFDFQGVRIAENSALIANYLIPFDETDSGEHNLSTLHLQLYENVLGQYEFNCRIRCDIRSVTDPVTGESFEYHGDPYKYPILPNCIYAIGSPEHPYSLSKLIQTVSRGETPELEMECIPLE